MKKRSWITFPIPDPWISWRIPHQLGLEMLSTGILRLLQKVIFFKILHNALIQSEVMILFVLRFYGTVNPLGSSRARSVYLASL